jgi:hypothetical protein
MAEGNHDNKKNNSNQPRLCPVHRQEINLKHHEGPGYDKEAPGSIYRKTPASRGTATRSQTRTGKIPMEKTGT